MRYLVFLALCFMASPVSAETALEMQSWCRPVAQARFGTGGRIHFEESYSTGLCWGAFAAIQKLSTFDDAQSKAMLGICAPPETTRIQLIKVFLRYADLYPGQAHEEFGTIAWRALQATFPCK